MWPFTRKCIKCGRKYRPWTTHDQIDGAPFIVHTDLFRPGECLVCYTAESRKLDAEIEKAWEE